MREIADRDLKAAAEIDDFAEHAVGGREKRGDEARGRVAHEGEIASGMNRAQSHGRSAPQQLRDDGRHHRARGLPRPVGVEGTDDGDRRRE